MDTPYPSFEFQADNPFRVKFLQIRSQHKQWHPEIEILLILSGTVTVDVQGTESRLREGDLLLINSSHMGENQNMYLLEGGERSLLIDTGWGSGTLRAYVESLTDKPVEVLLTHGHLDHSGSCGEWELARMLPGAVADLVTLERGPFDVSKLPHPDYEKKFVSDGDVVGLGGRSVRLLDISAHSNGSLAVLDPKNGYLFVGDEMESAQVFMYEVEPRPDRSAFVLRDRLIAHRRNMLRLNTKI